MDKDPDGCGLGCGLFICYLATGFIVTALRLKLGPSISNEPNIEAFVLLYFFLWPMFLLVDLGIHGSSFLVKLIVSFSKSI